jgi:hypothetical protein
LSSSFVGCNEKVKIMTRSANTTAIDKISVIIKIRGSQERNGWKK